MSCPFASRYEKGTDDSRTPRTMALFSAILRNVGEDRSTVPAKAVCAATSSANAHDTRDVREVSDARNARTNDLGKVRCKASPTTSASVRRDAPMALSRLGPAIAQADNAIEHRRAGFRIDTVSDEIAVAFEVSD